MGYVGFLWTLPSTSTMNTHAHTCRQADTESVLSSPWCCWRNRGRHSEHRGIKGGFCWIVSCRLCQGTFGHLWRLLGSMGFDVAGVDKGSLFSVEVSPSIGFVFIALGAFQNACAWTEDMLGLFSKFNSQLHKDRHTHQHPRFLAVYAVPYCVQTPTTKTLTDMWTNELILNYSKSDMFITNYQQAPGLRLASDV